ncbi:MAG: T9SS type A sorting domain-containing protein [Crocinitomicaceae bacterium]|nr:T9SS type A sorting domain-containing protein [Crocinitomicaceae bacterium]
MKKIAFFFLLVSSTSFGQSPITNTTLGITMQCSGGTDNRSGIAFNPNQQLYYSVNTGSPSYPIETFDLNGNLLSTNNSGFDYRGAWWNPNNNQLEGNGYNTFGIWQHDLDVNFYPLNTGTNAIPGVSGPYNQSNADYDSNDDEILYYHNGVIYRYTRSAHVLISSVTISGLPVALSNINEYTIAYTGISNMEAGIYDYINKAFYFIDKTSGNYITSCQLPSTAPGPDKYKMSFANDHLWLYNAGASQWESYQTVNSCNTVTSTTSLAICDDQIPYTWNGLTFSAAGSQTVTLQSSLGCDSVATLNLTVNSVDTSTTSLAICDDQIPYTWNGLTFTAAGSQTTILQTSLGCDSVAILNLTVNSVDASTTTNGVNITSNATNATYQWLDCDSNYVLISGETDSSFTATTNGNYAVAVTQNGCTDTSSCVLINSVQISSNLNNVVSVYPNPTSDKITLKGINSLTEVSQIHLLDNKGALIKKVKVNETQVDLSSFSTGIYFIEIKHQLGTGRIKVVKQ